MELFWFGIVVIVGGYVISGIGKKTSKSAQAKTASNLVKGVGLILAIIGFFLAMIVIVPAGHRGVKMTFGAVTGKLSEGIHAIIPIVNKVELMEVRTQKESSHATAASKDLQIVTTDLALNFHIDPTQVDKLYREVGLGYKSRIIDPAVQESIKMVTAKFTAEELIKSRAMVKAEVELDITKRLGAYDIIVEPLGLSITNFDFSKEFNAAIEAKQVAQQEAEKQRYILQKAELERQTLVTQAKGAAEAAKLNAQALQAQGGSKVLAREWIQKWDGHVPTVAGTGGGGGGGVIIDINSLLKQE